MFDFRTIYFNHLPLLIIHFILPRQSRMLAVRHRMVEPLLNCNFIKGECKNTVICTNAKMPISLPLKHEP